MQQSSGLKSGRYPTLRGRLEADAAVIGGGLTGLTCAVWLSRAGLKVVLLEAKTLAFGASSCCGGMVSLVNCIRFHSLEKRAGTQTAQHYAQTMMRAFQSVKQLAQEGKCGWQEASAWLIQNESDERLKEEAEAMQRAGVDGRLKKEKAGTVLEIPYMGMMQPDQYLHCLVQNAENLGVRIFEGSRVVSVETNEARTSGGVVCAPYLIVATGYPVINVPGWYFLKIRQLEGEISSVHGPCSLDGMWFEMEGRYAVRPYPGGALIQSWDRETDRRKIAAQTGMTLAGAPRTGWECFTPDGLPFIGSYSSKTPNLFVAAGYEGKGILGSMLAAHAISARVLGLPSHGYDIYSGQRRVGDLKVPLAIGARYLEGMLSHPGAPRCPHMGCRLIQNPRTRIWECPCHGSRFDDIGHVLSAPAVQDAVLQERRQKK